MTDTTVAKTIMQEKFTDTTVDRTIHQGKLTDTTVDINIYFFSILVIPKQRLLESH